MIIIDLLARRRLLEIRDEPKNVFVATAGVLVQNTSDITY